MKLQETLSNVAYLDENARKNMLYTNARFMNDIAEKINENGIDYSRSYANLTGDQNTNQILTAVQLRSEHLNKNPLGNK
jgi:hypothetical protein